MPLSPVQIKPGINSQLTQAQATGQWWASNLIRWRDGGGLEKIAGWARLIQDQAVGLIRAMHAYQDLSATNLLLLGTDGGAQVYNGTTLSQFLFNRRYSTSRANSVTFTSGSSLAVVYDVGHGVLAGQVVLFPITMTGGGRFYLGGSQFTVASVIDANSYNITLPAPALASGVASLPYYTNSPYPGTTGSYNVPVYLPAHGLTAGSQFAVQQPFKYNYPYPGGNEPSMSVPAGSYLITNVIDANNFQIQSTIYVPTVPYNFVWSETGYQGLPARDAGPPISYIISNAPVNPLNWFLDNFGQIALISAQNGGLYQFTPPVTGATPVAVTVTNAPVISAGMFVAMPQAQVVCFGADVSGVQDPLLIRWSDTSNQTVWTASATNQAGSYRLSQGSKIVGGIQGPRVGLIWTDIDVWLMQYSGPPFIYNFLEMASGCGLISPKARLVLDNTVYWMSFKSFYSYDGNGVRGIPCTVWDFIFNDLDLSNLNKIHAGSDSAYNEGWFFFPSASGGTGECDKYVKFTIVDGGVVWDSGSLPRTAWVDTSVYGTLGGDINRRIQQHDIGWDADGAAMANVYAESGYASDGAGITAVNEIIPDMKWFGPNPGAVMVTLKGTNFAQATPFQKGPYGLDMANMHIRPRMRARYISMRLDWVERLGFGARFGAFMFRTFFSGKRP